MCTIFPVAGRRLPRSPEPLPGNIARNALHYLRMDFDKLAEQHKDAVYRQMVRLCGNHEDAEDVLVEALVKAYRAMGQLEDEAAFRGWLAIIARRTCGRLKRQEAMTPVLRLAELSERGLEPASREALPEEQALEADTKQCILNVIATLPPSYRDIYTQADIEERPLKEIAETLDLTLATVKARLHRARALVRQNLDQHLCLASSP
jgi:RNA polymerase sigma-70 factor (ECF subfamily)